MELDLDRNEDKLRLRVGDFNDPILLPTSVYTATLAENNNNVNKCVPIIAVYLLNLFAQQTHEKMSYLEVWGKERYDSYKDWLLNVVMNPKFSSASPIPYAGANSTSGNQHQIVKFIEDWNESFEGYNELEDLNIIAETGT